MRRNAILLLFISVAIFVFGCSSKLESDKQPALKPVESNLIEPKSFLLESKDLEGYECKISSGKPNVFPEEEDIEFEFASQRCLEDWGEEKKWGRGVLEVDIYLFKDKKTLEKGHDILRKMIAAVLYEKSFSGSVLGDRCFSGGSRLDVQRKNVLFVIWFRGKKLPDTELMEETAKVILEKIDSSLKNKKQ